MDSRVKKRKGGKSGRLQLRLTQIVLTAVSAAFLLVFVIVIYTSNNQYRKQEIDNQRNQLDKTASQIYTLQNTVENLARQIIYNDVVQKGVSTKESSTGMYLYMKRNVQETLTNYAHIMNAIQEIMIYTADGRTFSSRNIRDPFKPEKNQWYGEFFDSGRNTGYTAVHSSEPNQDGYTMDVISYMVSYYSVEKTGQELGKLVISIDFNVLKEMAHLESDLLKGYCFYDSMKIPLMKEGGLNRTYDEIIENMDGNGNGLIQETDGDVFIVSDQMQDGWMLVSEISGDMLMRKSVQAYMYLLVIFAFILVILLLGLRYFIRRIVNPINQLSEAAVNLGSGNFEVSVSIRTDDELEMLAEVFNKMVVDIRTLMHESVEHEKALRRMQIENLMLQINPHFIYNTMNSIVYMAKMGGNTQIADFANAFISLLQSTLDVRDSICHTVREELNTVENYLYLQKYRYEDKFTYEIVCEEALKECMILNVMLQPAVENAIFHGIAPKDEKSILRISICRKGTVLEACVEDNGIGMSKEKVDELMRPGYTQKGGVRKIGVANVKARIRENFGEPYDLLIESELGVGTKVIMSVPYMVQESVSI
ncbi:MAG: sensor histidine kinase [Eubacteriales bacterium]|nr:sensor histidine kinase [Eubacteriales bacterium]